MRQDNKSYLFKPQDLLDLYYKLVNRFLQEEVEECKEQLSDQIIDTFIEIGPSRTLSGFLRDIDRSVTTFNVEDMKSLNKTLEGILIKNA